MERTLDADRLRQIIADGYERCARTAEHFGAREVAAAIRRGAGRIEVLKTPEGFTIDYPTVQPPLSNMQPTPTPTVCECGRPARKDSRFCSKECREASERTT